MSLKPLAQISTIRRAELRSAARQVVKRYIMRTSEIADLDQLTCGDDEDDFLRAAIREIARTL